MEEFELFEESLEIAPEPCEADVPLLEELWVTLEEVESEEVPLSEEELSSEEDVSSLLVFETCEDELGISVLESLLSVVQADITKTSESARSNAISFLIS